MSAPAAAQIPLIAPGATWTGVAGSGFVAAPTDPVRTESKTGAQVTPAFVDFQTPPVAVPA